MATGYTLTQTGNTTKVVHITDDVIDAVDGITGPVWIQNKGTTIEISQGGSILMSMPAASILTIAGAAPEEDISDLIDQLIAVFPDASSGGGAINFTEMVDETWYWATKSEAITIITDVDITTVGSPSPGKCIMFIQDGTGGHVPTLNGDDSFADINTAANAVTIFCLIERENGDFGVIVDTSYVPITIPTPDVTAPTATYEAIDAHTIVETFDEDTTGDGVGVAFSNGAPLTINSATRNSATEIEYDIDEEMTDADTIVFERASSDIEDLAGNPLADDTGSVTNSIVGGVFETANRVTLQTPSTRDTVTAPGFIAKWANKDGDTDKDFLTIGGTARPNDITDGLEFTGTQNLANGPTHTLVATAGNGFTLYFELVVTGAGGILPSSGGSPGYGVYFVDASNMLIKFNGGAASCAFGIPFNTRGVLAVGFENGVPAEIHWEGALLGSANLASGTGHVVYELGGGAGDRFVGELYRHAEFSVKHNSAKVTTESTLLLTEA